MSERRIEISFGVDSSELSKLDKVMTTIARFNDGLEEMKQTFGKMPPAFSGFGDGVDKNTKKLNSLAQGVKQLDTALNAHRFEVNSVTSAQTALSNRLEKWGRNVRVTLADNGRFTGSLVTANNQTMKLSGSFDMATGKIENMRKTAITTSNAVDKMNKELAEARKRAELMRGTDITARIGNPAAFNVYKDSLVLYGRVLTASIDKNGKFTQSVVNQRGELVKITGYYDKATKSIIQYNREVSKASSSQLGRVGFSADSVNRIGMMAESMKGLNRQTVSWNESMQIAGLRMIQWTASATLIFGTQQALAEMMHTIIEVDTQMTELQKVMNEDTNFPAMLERSTLMATEFGRKITDVNEAMIEFGRMGYNESQIAQMAKATTLLANVGDIDSGQAASRLTGIMTVYKKEVSDAVSVVDRFNEVQNKFPVTVENLTDAVAKSGSAAHAFGVTMEENIGHVTAIASATRESGSIIGNSLKTLYARATTLGPAIDALGSVGVNVFDEFTGAVRPVSDIFEELSGKWGGLTDAQRQNTAVQVAGKHHLTRFIALMENYDTALAATETSHKSWGSAMRENQTYMESMRAQINIFWASLQELALTIGENGLGAAFLATLKIATQFVQGINGIVDTFGAFSGAIPVAIGMLGLLAFNFHKINGSAQLLRATTLTLNPTITATAVSMGMSTASATALSAAFSRVAVMAKTMTLALLTNPLTWITVAVAGVVGLVGKMEQLEARNQTLAETTKNANDEYKSFLDRINNGTVETYDIEKYKTQLSELSDVQETLAQVTEKNFSSMQTANGNYGILSTNVQALKMTKDELRQSYQEEAIAMDVLSDKQQDLLAQMGINIQSNTTLAEVLGQVDTKQSNMTKTLELAEESMQKAKDQAIIPTADAYFDMAENIDATASAMENAMGMSNPYLESLKEARGIIELLSEAEGLNAQQKEILAGAEQMWADQLGVSRDEIQKRPEAMQAMMDNELNVWAGILEVSKRAVDDTATDEEKRRVQRDLTAKNHERNAKIEENARLAQLEVEKKATVEEARIQNGRKLLFESTSSGIEQTFRLTTESVLTKLAEQRTGHDDTRNSYQKMMEGIGTDSVIIDSSVNNTEVNTSKSFSEMRKQMETTGNSSGSLAKKAEETEGKINVAHQSILGGATSYLSSTRSQVDETTKKYGELETEAKNIPKGIAKGITDFMNDPVGAIKKLAENLVSKFKEALGIKSPSRVFMSMGKHVLDGLIKGLNVDNMKQLGMNAFKDFAGGAFSTIDDIKAFVSGDFSMFGGGMGGGGGVQKWRGLAAKALAMTGQLTPANLERMLMQMNSESGGNAAAINKWDINWKNGIPSKGLMQVIDPTFRAYAHPQFNKNVYDPLSNMLASIRYSLSRYGSLTRAWRGKGYADGGITGNQYLQAVANGSMPDGGFTNNPVFVDNGNGIAGEAGPEAIIPLSGGKRSKALKLYDRVGQILGVTAYADGGTTGTYKIKSGDTLSKIAQTFKTTVDALMKLNTSIKNANKIYAGQTIKVSSGASTTAPVKGGTTTVAPKPFFKNAEEAEKFLNAEKELISTWQELEVVGEDYYTRMFSSAKHREAVMKLGRQAINEYNKNQMDAISSMDSVETAYKYFRQANLIMSEKTRHKVWTNIKDAVTQNVVDVFKDKATKSVETFNKAFIETDEATEQFTSTIRNFEQARDAAFRTEKIEAFKVAMYESVGLLKDFMPDEGTTAGQLAKVKAQIEDLVNSTAELETDLDPQKLNDRTNYLKSEMDRVYARMLVIRQDMITRGVTDREKIREAQGPLWEIYYDLERQYNQMITDMNNGGKYIDQNKDKIAELTEQYKRLKDQLEKENAKREFTDFWGNVVRDAEGQAKMIDWSGQLIINTYEQVRDKIEQVAKLASGANSSLNPASNLLAQVQAIFSGFAPTFAATVNNGSSSSNTTNSNNNQTNTYQADTNVTRNVTYVVQTGVALASETELREFAMIIKDMIDEEEGRGES